MFPPPSFLLHCFLSLAFPLGSFLDSIFLLLLPICFYMLYTLSIRALGILIMLLSLLFSLSIVFNSFVTPRTVAPQAPLSIGFPREEYGSGLPFSSPGDLPDSWFKPRSPALAGRFFTTEPPGKPWLLLNSCSDNSNITAMSSSDACLSLQKYFFLFFSLLVCLCNFFLKCRHDVLD